MVHHAKLARNAKGFQVASLGVDQLPKVRRPVGAFVHGALAPHCLRSFKQTMYT